MSECLLRAACQVALSLCDRQRSAGLRRQSQNFLAIPRESGGSFEIAIVGNNKITLKNILVGEVWVCSGQSNMQWAVKNSANPEEEIAEANYPKGIKAYRCAVRMG